MRHTVRVPESPIPQHCPTARELDDLELLVHGALAPLTGFEGPDGLVTLQVPPSVADAARAAGSIELVDPEGVPLAHVEVASTYDAGELTGIEGPVTTLAHNEFGAFRRLYLTPTEVAERYDADTLTVPVAGPLTVEDLDRIRTVRRRRAGAAAGPHRHRHPGAQRPRPGPRNPGRRPAPRRRPRGGGAARQPGRRRGRPPARRAGGRGLRPRARPRRDRDGRPAGRHRRDRRARPARTRRSRAWCCSSPACPGSGKSTLARALHDVVLEQGARTVTSLDGDVVRRNLSAGLTFSKEDRETNIRRIGWVAAEISRHGGVAICSPIAPFDSTRQQVRHMVEDAGGAFVLVHVATPLEECERRDRKGLYAKARAGEIPEFTGISSPYEVPEDAAVRVDTTGRSIADALDDVLAHLYEAGYLTKDLP